MAVTVSESLGCGRLRTDFEDLAAVDAAHADCDVCAGYRRDLDELHAVAAELADADPAPAATLSGAIMAAVRADFRQGARLPLPAGPEGPAAVTERAVAVVLRAAADEEPGVHARSCRVAPDPRRPGCVEVRLTLVVFYPAENLAETSARVRRRVRQALHDGVGLAASSIDVTVVDLLDEQ